MTLTAETFIDPAVHRNGIGVVRYGTESLPVRIYDKAVENEAKSVAAKRKIFDDVVFIEIQCMPISRTKQGDIVDRPLREEDKHKYPHAWQAYLARKEGKEYGPGYTPLTEWDTPHLTEGRKEELRALKIVSVEQVANMPDGVVNILGDNARELKAAAERELKHAAERAKTDAPVMELKGQLEELEVERELLKDELAELKKVVASFQTESSKGKKSKSADD